MKTMKNIINNIKDFYTFGYDFGLASKHTDFGLEFNLSKFGLIGITMPIFEAGLGITINLPFLEIVIYPRGRFDTDLLRFEKTTIPTCEGQIVPFTTIPPMDQIRGIIAYKTLSIEQASNNELKLISEFQKTEWGGRELTAHIPPTENTETGIYAYHPAGVDARAFIRPLQLSSLVELRGRIIQHANGTYRAEWARLLQLYVNANQNRATSVKLANYLSFKYGVPATITSSLNFDSYLKWARAIEPVIEHNRSVGYQIDIKETNQ